MRTRKRMLILPAVMAIILLFLLYRNSAAAADEGKTSPSDDYLYLAEISVINNEHDDAVYYLKKLYANYGVVPEATLLNARIAAIDGDFAGAAVLYDKIEKMGQTDLFTQSDTKIRDAASEGYALTVNKAAAILSEVALLRKDGKDPSEYGYDADFVKKCEDIADGSSDFAASVLAEIEDDVKKKEKSDKRFEALTEALLLTDSIEENYAAYTRDLSHSEPEVKDDAKALKKIYEDNPGIFSVFALDEAFVKAMIMSDDLKTLIGYAEKTGSQTALVTLSQLLVDEHINDKDLPDGFVKLSANEQKRIAKQCREALARIKDKKEAEGAELKNLNDKVAAVEALADKPAVAEIDSRIDPSSAPLDEQSKLYLGSSAFHYAEGNTAKADAELSKSIETAPYSSDDNYSEACENISSVVFNTESDNSVKNVGAFLKDAYDLGVVNKNPDEQAESESGRNSHSDDYDDVGDDDADNKEPDDPRNMERPKRADDEDKEQVPARELLTTQGTTYVTKQKAMINISGVDTSKFPEISFNVQTAGELDLENAALLLRDCGITIEDFTIKKQAFDTAKIYMVCDKSGSMEGSTDTLQAAVRSFASNITDKEKIGLIGFSSSVEFCSGLVGSVSELEGYISQLVANGGTDIAAGAFYAVGELSGSKDSFNVIVVMTDGEDSSFTQGRLEELRSSCEANNIILYTIGLGASTNPSYLSTIADYGDGQFMYSYSASELEALYNFIHSQMENNYVVTFTAKDKSTWNRQLVLTNLSDSSTTTKEYTVDPDLLEEPEEEEEEFSVKGFKEKKIYKQDSEVKARIVGSKFEKNMKCVVSISGTAYRGTLHGSYVDEESFEVVIPANVPFGTYEAEITVSSTTINETIEILDDDEHTIKYGAYTFTAGKVVRDDERKTIELKNGVSMGGFVNFNGDVTLLGDIEKDKSITMRDYSGFTITFEKELPGMLGRFCGQTVYFNSLGDLTIYNDDVHKYDLDSYKVDEITSTPNLNVAALIFKSPSFGFYPHKIGLNVGQLSFNFPFQEQVFKGIGKDLVTAEANCEATIDGEGVFTSGSISLGNDGGFYKKTVAVGTRNFGITSFNLAFDTYKHDYSLGLGVSFALMGGSSALDNANTVSLDVGFKGGSWDSFLIHYKGADAIPLIPGKLWWNNFAIGIEDLSSSPSIFSDFLGFILRAKFEGGADFELFNISNKLPILKTLFSTDGDVTLLTFADTMLTLSFEELAVTAKSNIKLLGQMDFGKVDFSLGMYTYSDYLLGIPESDVAGFNLYTSIGPEIHTANFDVVAQGATHVGINNKASFYKTVGTASYDINILGKHSGDINGISEVAITYNGVDDIKFYIIMKNESLSSNISGGFKACLAGWSWDTGVEFY